MVSEQNGKDGRYFFTPSVTKREQKSISIAGQDGSESSGQVVHIRNYTSGKPIAPRLFDLEINGDRIDAVFKLDKDKFERIPWKDIAAQVEAAKNDKLPQQAP